VISQVAKKLDYLLYHSPPVNLASLLLVLPEASPPSIIKWRKGRGVLGWVIIEDRGGDHHHLRAKQN